MKILSALKFITILGLGAIILLGCVRERPKPVVKETQPSDPNYYIGPGGYAIDLREREKQFKREAQFSVCIDQLQYYSGDAKIKQLEKCNEIGK